MALFFDAAWFDQALARAGLDRNALAARLGLDTQSLDEMWKDQREISGSEVVLMAQALGVAPADVAHRAGVSTPVPRPDDPQILLAEVARLEAELAHLRQRIEATLGVAS